MTNIGVISDIHAEFLNVVDEPLKSIVEQKFYDIDYSGLDVLCISGDVDYQTRGIDFINKYILSNYPSLKVVYVCGNHEYWRGSLESTVDKLKLETENNSNIYFLHNSYADIEGIRFIGSTLWTDYNKKNDLAMCEAKDSINDFRKVRALNGTCKLLPIHLYNEHLISKKYIFDTIEQSSLPTIVVTHHKPYIGKGCVRDLLGYAYCSDLTYELEELSKKPLYWFSGHDHRHSELEMLGIQFISNPLGYYTEYTHVDFDMNCCKVTI